jgi:hypothetical protein
MIIRPNQTIQVNTENNASIGLKRQRINFSLNNGDTLRLTDVTGSVIATTVVVIESQVCGVGGYRCGLDSCVSCNPPLNINQVIEDFLVQFPTIFGGRMPNGAYISNGDIFDRNGNRLTDRNNVWLLGNGFDLSAHSYALSFSLWDFDKNGIPTIYVHYEGDRNRAVGGSFFRFVDGEYKRVQRENDNSYRITATASLEDGPAFFSNDENRNLGIFDVWAGSGDYFETIAFDNHIAKRVGYTSYLDLDKVNFDRLIRLQPLTALQNEIEANVRRRLGLTNTRGNTVSNIANGGFVATFGEWVFYSNLDDNGNLYRMRFDGSGNQLLARDKSSHINVVGDWVYYLNPRNGANGDIYRIRTDGSNRQKLNDSFDVTDVSVVGDWVYYRIALYTTYNNAGYVYRVRTDGSNRQVLISERTFEMNVVDGWIYYVTRSGEVDNGIYRVRIDGSGRQIVVRENSGSVPSVVGSFSVVGDWIYYAEHGQWNDNNDRLHRVRTDGTGQQTIFTGNVECFNVHDGWIYFIEGSWHTDNILYKMRTDGSERQILRNFYRGYTFDAINIVGDWVYLDEGGGYGSMAKIRTNGTAFEVFGGARG